MSRVKQAGKHTRTNPNAPQPPLRLSETLVERWFEEDDERTAYDERLSRMEILPPKYIGDGVLPDAKYPEFWRLIDIQGLRPFLYTRRRYYPRFVAAAFTTIFIREDKDEGEEFALGFRLGSREYKFTLAALATAWGLKDEGDTFKGGNYPLGTWNEFSKATTMRELYLDQQDVHGPSSPVVCVVLRTSPSEEQSWYCYRGGPFDPMSDCKREADSLAIPDGTSDAPLFTGQGLAHLWTGLFEMAPMDLSREEVVNPGSANIITSKNINQMRRNLVDQADAAEGVPTETEVPSQEQSEVVEFIRKGFEDMRMMMSEGFTRLSERIDGLDTHMTCQDVDIRSLRDEFRSFKGEDVAIDPPEHQDDVPTQD
ncbi:hypothetical protein PIB30_094183 [Stylosanthes scabra]|uniref:Uncharacterized protein n=1 Tax=Stylosanthes scabra TaxID=79078 RepID=A0ABU6YU51_9FABA|nr:hypothetical protein [Stylosanthes scabra]